MSITVPVTEVFFASSLFVYFILFYFISFPQGQLTRGWQPQAP